MPVIKIMIYDILIHNISLFLPVPDLVNMVVLNRSMNMKFKQYIDSGGYLVDIAGGLDKEKLPDLETALYPFDYKNGYPRVYHLIYELYRHKFIHVLPKQVQDMIKSIPTSYTYGIRQDSPALYDPIYQIHQYIFPRIPEIFRDNKDIVTTAVQRDGMSLKYASKRLQDDYDVVLAAVQKNGIALRYASDRLKDDRKIVMATVTQDGRALHYASKRLQDDKDIAKAAVCEDKLALKLISHQLQNDKDIILAAVTRDGMALVFVSDRLKDDKDIVLAAVTQDGTTLQLASRRLQNDKDIILAAKTQEEFAKLKPTYD